MMVHPLQRTYSCNHFAIRVIVSNCARCGWELIWWWSNEEDSSMVWAASVNDRKLCVGLCCKYCDAYQSCHLHEDELREVLVLCIKGYLLLLQLSAWCFCWVRSFHNKMVTLTTTSTTTMIIKIMTMVVIMIMVIVVPTTYSSKC